MDKNCNLEIECKTLLYNYYKISYNNLLGVTFPNLLNKDECEDFLKNILSKRSTKKKVFNYIFKLAPKAKVRPLIKFLKENNISPNSFLDFGCGIGNCTMYIAKRVKSIKKVIGIDNDLTLKNMKINTFSSLKNVKNLKFDLITSIHVLHHLGFEKQTILIKNLSKKMKKNGILYIYEDSWSDKTKMEKSDELNIRFQSLSSRGKKLLFLENEYWANKRFYNRNINFSHINYKNIENWLKILKRLNFRILNYSVQGFDYDRLHGIPAAFIIATL